MSKTISVPMKTAISQEVTSLVTATLITRTDGKQFRFTSNTTNMDIDIGDGKGVRRYLASEGYSRSNIQNDADLNVGNSELIGVFDNAALKEDELRRGLFDFADFKLFFFDFNDVTTTTGIIKMVRGEFGRVIVTPQGFFNVELRDLTQVFSKQLGEFFSKDCREDLGGPRCRIPLSPDNFVANNAYVVGDFIKASNKLAHVRIYVRGEDDVNDSVESAVGTLGSETALSNVVTFTAAKFGDRSIEFSPTAAVDPSNAFISYPDNANYVIGTNQFTIEMWVRFKDLTADPQVFASHYLNTGNQRSWFLARVGNNLRVFLSDDGTSTAPALSIDGAFTWAVDTWYHIAVSRDASNNVRLFVDGTQVGTTTVITFAIHDSTTVLYLGKFRSAGGTDLPLNGYIEDFRFTIGKAHYTSTFTPPIAPHQLFNELNCEDFDDRIYQITTAGTSGAVQPTMDTVVTNTTVSGGATFTAEESWTRKFQVVSVSVARRQFKVTELTPNTGGPRGGFATGWFDGGAVFFDTGNNAGIGTEVRTYLADDGITIEQDIELFDDMPFDIQVGDKGCIQPGCDKVFATCRDKFLNQKNFVGEPYVPTEDTLGQYPDARG